MENATSIWKLNKQCKTDFSLVNKNHFTPLNKFLVSPPMEKNLIIMQLSKLKNKKAFQ